MNPTTFIMKYTTIIYNLCAVLLLAGCTKVYDGPRSDIKHAEFANSGSVQSSYATSIEDLHTNAYEDWKQTALDSAQVERVISLLHAGKPCSYFKLSEMGDGMVVSDITRMKTRNFFYVSRDMIAMMSKSNPYIWAAWSIPHSKQKEAARLINEVKAVVGDQQPWVSYSDRTLSLRRVGFPGLGYYHNESRSIQISFLASDDNGSLSVDYRLSTTEGDGLQVTRTVTPKDVLESQIAMLENQNSDLKDVKSNSIEDSFINDLLLTKFPNWYKMTNKERMDMLDSCAHSLR